jgi:hypothetical protein
MLPKVIAVTKPRVFMASFHSCGYVKKIDRAGNKKPEILPDHWVVRADVEDQKRTDQCDIQQDKEKLGGTRFHGWPGSNAE